VRDRNFLVQTLVLPLFIVASQWLVSGTITSLGDLWAHPVALAAGAFGVAAYALMLSAFQTLNAEGGALWLLYTFPQPIEGVLRQKALLWAVLTLVYPLVVFALQAWMGPPLGWHALGPMAMAVLGVPIYATIATSLGVFGCDPLAQEAGKRVRLSYTYLYMLMAGWYVYGIAAGRWWQSLAVVVLSASLALALWQKARDALPCLLDPAAAPPACVSAADGLICATLFFALQGAGQVIAELAGHHVDGLVIAMSFVAAGAVTTLCVRLMQWRARVADVPAVFGTGNARSAAWGVVAGAAAAVAGIVALRTMEAWGWMNDPARWGDPAQIALGVWTFPLLVLAAPLFEEFIFRGLLYGGLRRSMGSWQAATASAAVFAIVHPPISMLPVFVLGLCTARAYERSRTLLAPIVAHAVYNAAILAWQKAA
jgi:membrane protease YdiL (CAAX protease family)